MKFKYVSTSSTFAELSLEWDFCRAQVVQTRAVKAQMRNIAQILKYHAENRMDCPAD
jgi:hypothetical protein